MASTYQAFALLCEWTAPFFASVNEDSPPSKRPLLFADSLEPGIRARLRGSGGIREFLFDLRTEFGGLGKLVLEVTGGAASRSMSSL